LTALPLPRLTLPRFRTCRLDVEARKLGRELQTHDIAFQMEFGSQQAV